MDLSGFRLGKLTLVRELSALIAKQRIALDHTKKSAHGEDFHTFGTYAYRKGYAQALDDIEASIK